MTDDLIVISEDQIDVQDIMRQIRANIARRKGESVSEAEPDPLDVSRELWDTMIGESVNAPQAFDRIPISRYDADIFPHQYAIDWHIPILGPIHAVVRRLINAEVRRYLDVSLRKQTRFNESLLCALRHLVQENHVLRQELDSLRQASACDAAPH